MAPEYGATCGFFGIDDKTLDYMRLTGRSAENIALVEAYAKAQGLWLSADMPDPRSEEHTSELQSLMRISYAVVCLKKNKTTNRPRVKHQRQIHNKTTIKRTH